MSLFYYILILCVIFGIVKYFLAVQNFLVCSRNFPGRFPYPIFGNVLEFVNRETIYDKSAEMIEYLSRPSKFWVFHKLKLYVHKPQHLEIIFNSKECLNKIETYDFIAEILGYGLFLSTGKKWAKHRKLLNPVMHQSVLVKFFPIFNSECDTFVKFLKPLVGKPAFCINELLEKCVLDITCRTTMGTKLEIQKGQNQYVLEAYQSIKNIVSSRAVTPMFYIDFIYKMSNLYKLQEKSKAVLEKFIKNLITNKVKERKLDKFDGESKEKPDNNEILQKSKNIFIDQALNIADRDPEFTLENVEENAHTMVFASFETTVIAVAYTIFCLADCTEYQEKVINEIRTLFPDKNSEITFEDTKNMTYTEMVINETLRLFPSVPLVGRQASADFYFDGILIPKGTEFILDILSLHRDKFIWGENHNKFDPEHFSPENVSRMHPYQFVPFTKGPRICIGWRYAYMSMKVMLAKIFQNYRFTTDFKIEDIKFRLNLTLKAVNQPLVRVHTLEN